MLTYQVIDSSVIPLTKKVVNSNLNYYRVRLSNSNSILYFKEDVFEDIKKGVQLFKTEVIQSIKGHYQVFVLHPEQAN